MEMHDPAHPGEIVREECLNPLGLTVTAAAEALGVTRKALSDLLNGHTGVSPDMAIRLEKVFGSTADTWLRMQMQRDLWEARQRADKIKVNRRFATAVLCQASDAHHDFHRTVPSPASLRSAPSPAMCTDWRDNGRVFGDMVDASYRHLWPVGEGRGCHGRRSRSCPSEVSLCGCLGKRG